MKLIIILYFNDLYNSQAVLKFTFNILINNILVSCIREGYWSDGQLNGQGRRTNKLLSKHA